jgi:hypothetical protein
MDPVWDRIYGHDTITGVQVVGGQCDRGKRACNAWGGVCVVHTHHCLGLFRDGCHVRGVLGSNCALTVNQHLYVLLTRPQVSLKACGPSGLEGRSTQ